MAVIYSYRFQGIYIVAASHLVMLVAIACLLPASICHCYLLLVLLGCKHQSS